MRPSFIPFAAWPRRVARADLRADLSAGLIGALIALPQGIALAMLAGMPPVYGLYTSIVPVVLAAIWGASWQQISGPNTAVSVLLAASLAPLAVTATSDYIALVFLVTALVGAAQLAIGFLRLGRALDFVSSTVVLAIVQAVALVLIVSYLPRLLGIELPGGLTLSEKLLALTKGLGELKPPVLAVSALTLAVAVLGKRGLGRYAMIVALVAGSALGYGLNLQIVPTPTPGAALIPTLGEIGFADWPFGLPALPDNAAARLPDLIGPALAIALLGLIQSAVIARMLAAKTGQRVGIDQEIVGQGMANVLAPLAASFAGSGSFNRSAANLQLGARTPWAAVAGALGLLVMCVFGGALIAAIPLAAVAALLILVGVNLIDVAGVRRAWRTPEEAWIFAITFVACLALDLVSGVFTGVALSLAFYLWKTSRPNVDVHDYLARSGETVHQVTLAGNLYFGSVAAVEASLPQVATADARAILLVDTQHLTYLDIPGAELLVRQAEAWRKRGRQAYLHVARSDIDAALARVDVGTRLGSDAILRPTEAHPLKAILHPLGSPMSTHKTQRGMTMPDLELLARRLRATPWLDAVPLPTLVALLAAQTLESAERGEYLASADAPLPAHLLLLEGELEIERIWRASGSGREQSHRRTLAAAFADGLTAFLPATGSGIRVRAASAVRYLLLDADTLDDLVGWSRACAAVSGESPLCQRLDILRRVGVLHRLPFERLHDVLDTMQEIDVAAGEVIVRQGEPGDSYYVLESGDADVVRSDPLGETTGVVDTLSAGDAFGEESLLQDGYRNATIRMTSPGRLWRLSKADFLDLVRPSLVDEIDAGGAQVALISGESLALDCRYDMEYEESRLPGALWIPLHELRARIAELDPARAYVVYCRSGRRSRAAAFLLRERNIKAVSLVGGLQAWPHGLDAEPVVTAAA